MKNIRSLGTVAAVGVLLTLGGCVAVPGGPVYSDGYYSNYPSNVYVEPAPVYINGGYSRGPGYWGGRNPNYYPGYAPGYRPGYRSPPVRGVRPGPAVVPRPGWGGRPGVGVPPGPIIKTPRGPIGSAVPQSNSSNNFSNRE